MIRNITALDLVEIQIIASDLGFQSSDQEARFSLVDLRVTPQE